MSKPFAFTKQDAQNLVNVAESASLPNMTAAKQLAELISRFAQFYDAAMDAIAFQLNAEAAMPAQEKTPEAA